MSNPRPSESVEEMKRVTPGGDAPAILAAQIRHQVRIVRERMSWWISLIFVAGFGFSSLGLWASMASFREDGSITLRLVAFTVFFLLFGCATVCGGR